MKKLILYAFSLLTIVTNVACNMPQTETDKELLLAAKSGDSKTVTRLLSANPALEIRDENRRTPLMLATLGNHVEVARLLIEKGADVNAQDDIQDSPFLYAGASGFVDIARICISHGADFKIYNRFGGTALIPAAEKGHSGMVEELLKIKGFPKDHVNRLGWTAVLETVILTNGSAKFVGILKMLVDAGCNVNIPDADGVTALTHARRKKYGQMVDILDKAGAKE